MLIASIHFAECCDFNMSLTFNLMLFAARAFMFSLDAIDHVTLSVVTGILIFLLQWLFHNRSKLSQSSCGRCFIISTASIGTELACLLITCSFISLGTSSSSINLAEKRTASSTPTSFFKDLQIVLIIFCLLIVLLYHNALRSIVFIHLQRYLQGYICSFCNFINEWVVDSAPHHFLGQISGITHNYEFTKGK